VARQMRILCYVEGLIAGLPVGVERADGDEPVEILCTAHEESEAISWRIAAGDGGSINLWHRGRSAVAILHPK